MLQVITRWRFLNQNQPKSASYAPESTVFLCECLPNGYLSARPSDLVDDVREDDVLVSSLSGDLLPLHVVPQTDVVAPKRVRHALRNKSKD